MSDSSQRAVSARRFSWLVIRARFALSTSALPLSPDLVVNHKKDGMKGILRRTLIPGYEVLRRSEKREIGLTYKYKWIRLKHGSQVFTQPSPIRRYYRFYFSTYLLSVLKPIPSPTVMTFSSTRLEIRVSYRSVKKEESERVRRSSS